MAIKKGIFVVGWSACAVITMASPILAHTDDPYAGDPETRTIPVSTLPVGMTGSAGGSVTGWAGQEFVGSTIIEGEYAVVAPESPRAQLLQVAGSSDRDRNLAEMEILVERAVREFLAGKAAADDG